MRSDWLATLHCPYSGSKFITSNIVKGADDEIDYGIITSEAGDFPIVDGILRLRVDEYRSPLVSLIKRDQFKQALLMALEYPSYSRLGGAIARARRRSHEQW